MCVPFIWRSGMYSNKSFRELENSPFWGWEYNLQGIENDNINAAIDEFAM